MSNYERRIGVKARTEEYVFHRMNDLQWRMGIVEQKHSITITNSDKLEWARKLGRAGLRMVRQEEAGDFEVWGRVIDVDEDPIVIDEADCQEV